MLKIRIWKKGYIAVLKYAVFLFSCSPLDSNHFSFEEYHLVGTEVGPINFFGKPTSIISDHGKFVIADEATKDNLHYLDSTFSVIRSTGRSGGGPDELPSFVEILPIQPFEDKPLIIRAGNPLKKIKLNDSSAKLKLVNYPKDLLITQRIIVVNDSIIWGQGGSDQFKFMVVNTSNGEILKELPFTTYGYFFSSNILPYVFNGTGFYHPWLDRVVWTHINLNTIEFYYPDGELEKEWFYGDRWTEEELNNRYPVFMRSVPVPRGLLTMNVKEARRLKELGGATALVLQAIKKIKTCILFFNEKGEVQWSLKLDRFLNDFTFDVKNKRLVGVFGESEEQNIVVYELPEELLQDVGF